MGKYVFYLVLNDGYLFGANEATFPLEVEIIARINSMPYFSAPGLTPQQFYCEDAFTYVLPEPTDDDNDSVTVSFDNFETPWIALSAD